MHGATMGTSHKSADDDYGTREIITTAGPGGDGDRSSSAARPLPRSGGGTIGGAPRDINRALIVGDPDLVKPKEELARQRSKPKLAHQLAEDYTPDVQRARGRSTGAGTQAEASARAAAAKEAMIAANEAERKKDPRGQEE